MPVPAPIVFSKTAPILPCEHQQKRTIIEDGHSAQWAELKVIYIVLANDPLDETCSIFSDLGAVVNGISV